MTAIPAALKDQWTAYAQSLRLWVLQFVVWLAEITQLRALRLHAQNELRYLRREVRDILIARTVLEVEGDPPRRKRKRRAHVREWLTHQRQFRRFVLRGVRLRTFDDAKHVLDHLEASVARCVAQFRQGMSRRHIAWSGSALVAVSEVAGECADAHDTS